MIYLSKDIQKSIGIPLSSVFFLPLPFHGRRKERGEGPRGIISRAPKYLNNEFRGSTAAPHNNSHRCRARRGRRKGQEGRGTRGGRENDKGNMAGEKMGEKETEIKSGWENMEKKDGGKNARGM